MASLMWSRMLVASKRFGACPPVATTARCRCTTIWAARSSHRCIPIGRAVAHIAKAAGVPALVLNYRLSPEHKFPAQIDDVDNAYRWLIEQGYHPHNIASVGHSVGGNFAVSLALRLRDSGASQPGAVPSISPWVDMTLTNPTIDSNAEADKLLSRPLPELFRSLWLDGTDVGLGRPPSQSAEGRPVRPAADGDLLRGKRAACGRSRGIEPAGSGSGQRCLPEIDSGGSAFLHRRGRSGARGE